MDVRELEGLEPKVGLLRHFPIPEAQFMKTDWKFNVNLESGHKTVLS
jgi:hypothetical protein